MELKDIVNFLQGSRNIYYGTVIDNNDPLMFGRIRVHPEGEVFESMENSNSDFKKNSSSTLDGKWGKKDPLIFLPLLPYYINQVPQNGERVLIIYYNNNKKEIRDRFYLIGPYSSPTATLRPKGEDFVSSNTHLKSGWETSDKKWPNIKNIDGTYPENTKYNGVFAEPWDVSLKGRGTTDLILKNNDVILRAGKHKDFEGGKIPEIEPKRAFLQLSKFETKINIGEEQTIFRTENQKKQIKFLLEYDVINPESQPQIFTGVITIYKFIDSSQRLSYTNEFEYDTDLTGITNSKALILNIDTPLLIDDFAKFISEQVVTLVNKPTLLLSNLPQGQTTANQNDNTDGIQFPFYYRPSKNVRNILKNTPNQSSLDLTAYSNMQQLINKINVSTTDISPGYGLVLDAKFSDEVPFNLKKEKFRPITSENINNTVGLMGANYLYFLSNETTIPNKTKINFEEFDPGPKITQKDIDDKIVLNTSSMVRGEELLELLELIVGFLVSHVHPYPLLQPSSVSRDGTSTDMLLKKMLEAYNKVLNKNIRIN